MVLFFYVRNVFVSYLYPFPFVLRVNIHPPLLLFFFFHKNDDKNTKQVFVQLNRLSKHFQTFAKRFQTSSLQNVFNKFPPKVPKQFSHDFSHVFEHLAQQIQELFKRISNVTKHFNTFPKNNKKTNQQMFHKVIDTCFKVFKYLQTVGAQFSIKSHPPNSFLKCV